MREIPKKPYRPPRLAVHGKLRDLTRNASSNHNKDGGNNSIHSRT